MLKFCLLCFFAHCITALHKCKGKSIFQNTKQFFHFPVRRFFLLHSVRGLRLFPEQSISSSKFRSGIEGFSRTECLFWEDSLGKRVIFRTKCLCCGEKEFFLPLCPGGLSYRSRNWEESPGRKGQCTVESTDRRRVYARVTENYRRRSLIHGIRRAQYRWPVLYYGNRIQLVRWSTLR